MNVQVNEREALLIVTALGVYQNRLGQHTSCLQRKRMLTLRARLAYCVIIGDDDEVKAVRKNMEHTKKSIETRINLCKEISALRERLKSDTGVTFERVIKKEDDEDEASDC